MFKYRLIGPGFLKAKSKKPQIKLSVNPDSGLFSISREAEKWFDGMQIPKVSIIENIDNAKDIYIARDTEGFVCRRNKTSGEYQFNSKELVAQIFSQLTEPTTYTFSETPIDLEVEDENQEMNLLTGARFLIPNKSE